jgi:hypothetical protein
MTSTAFASLPCIATLPLLIRATYAIRPFVA